MKKKALIVLGILVLALFIREIELVDFNWYKSNTKITRYVGLFTLKKFKNVSDVQIVNELDEVTHYNIQDGDHLLRLTVQDRFSDWSPFHILPIYKFGESEHRIYYKVENKVKDGSWNVWAMVIGQRAEVDSSVLGICSSRKYREDVIRRSQEIGRASFRFLSDH